MKYIFALFLLGVPFLFFPSSIHAATDFTCGLAKPVLVTPLRQDASGTVQLKWNPVAGAQSYTIGVDNMTNILSPTNSAGCSTQSGDACYGTAGTTYNLPNIKAGTPYHVWVAAKKPDSTKPQGCLSGQSDAWINSNYRSIGGVVKDLGGLPVPNVGVTVLRGDQKSVSLKTDSSGRFNTSNFIMSGQYYAVRIQTVPSNYAYLPKTSTLGWTWNFCTNNKMIPGVPVDVYNQPFGDTVLGSKSYECQLAGSQIDCAGVENKSPYATNRCSFTIPKMSYTPAPPSITPEPRTPTPPTPAPELKTYDIVLILDKSSSIQTDIGKERNAATALVTGLSKTIEGKSGKIRIGLISYNKTVYTHNALLPIVFGSAAFNNLLANINTIGYDSANNGTCISCAENQALTLINGSTAVSKSVILISDGRANAPTITENPYPAINQPMKDAVTIAQNAQLRGISFFVAGYGSPSRTRGDVLSSISGDSEGIGTGTQTDTSLLNVDCSYPPSLYKNSSACNYIYEPSSLNWVNQYSKIAGLINPTFRTAVVASVAKAPVQEGLLASVRRFLMNMFGSNSADNAFADQQ